MTTSAFALSILVVAVLCGLSLAVSIEDEFYRSIRSPSSTAGLDDGAQPRGGEPRDSWRKIVLDMANYLKVLSENAEGIEKSLEDLAEKVDKLDQGGQENYNLYYAKKLLNDQRAAIEALQSAGSVPTGSSKQTDEYVRPQHAYRKKDQRSESPVDLSGAYQALQGLKKL